jgi:hypothetical protein
MHAFHDGSFPLRCAAIATAQRFPQPMPALYRAAPSSTIVTGPRSPEGNSGEVAL